MAARCRPAPPAEQLRAELALSIVAEAQDKRSGWRSAAALAVALGRDPGGFVLHGAVADILAALRARTTPILGADLMIRDFNDEICFCEQFEAITTALAEHSPQLRCVSIRNTITAVGLLRHLRRTCLNLERVDVNLVLHPINMALVHNDGVLGGYQGKRWWGNDDGSYPPADDMFTETLLWEALCYSKFHMALAPLTLDAWVAVLSQRGGILNVGITGVNRPVPSFGGDSEDDDGEPAVAAMRGTVERLYALLGEYPMERFEMWCDEEYDHIDFSTFLPGACLASTVSLNEVFHEDNEFDGGRYVTPETWPNLRTLVVNHGNRDMLRAGAATLLRNMGAQLTDLTISYAFLSNPDDDDAADGGDDAVLGLAELLGAAGAGSIQTLRLGLLCPDCLDMGWPAMDQLLQGLALTPSVRLIELSADACAYFAMTQPPPQLSQGGRAVRLLSNAEFRHVAAEAAAAAPPAAGVAVMDELFGDLDNFDVSQFLNLNAWDE